MKYIHSPTLPLLYDTQHTSVQMDYWLNDFFGRPSQEFWSHILSLDSVWSLKNATSQFLGWPNFQASPKTYLLLLMTQDAGFCVKYFCTFKEQFNKFLKVRGLSSIGYTANERWCKKTLQENTWFFEMISKKKTLLDCECGKPQTFCLWR